MAKKAQIFKLDTNDGSGQFGLGTQPVIYSNFGNYSVDSYFVTLRNQALIPSLSWSYTAGASYRIDSQLAWIEHFANSELQACPLDIIRS